MVTEVDIFTPRGNVEMATAANSSTGTGVVAVLEGLGALEALRAVVAAEVQPGVGPLAGLRLGSR